MVIGRKLNFARSIGRRSFSRQAECRGGRFLVFLPGWLLITHRDLARGLRAEAAHLILVVDFYRLAERCDLDHGDSISYKLDKPDGLRYVAVDPLLVTCTIRITTLLLAQLVLWSAESSENHSTVHPYQNFVSRNRVL